MRLALSTKTLSINSVLVTVKQTKEVRRYDSQRQNINKLTVGDNKENQFSSKRKRVISYLSPFLVAQHQVN